MHAELMIKEWRLLERISEWNPQIEHQKVICGNIVVKFILLKRIKETQKGDPMVYKWSEKSAKRRTSRILFGIRRSFKV